MPLMNQAQYARHRGVNRVQITKLKNKGFFDGCWRKKSGKLHLVSVLADKRWESDLHPAYVKGARVTDDVPADTEKASDGEITGQDYKTARTWVERFKAANQKLDFEIKTGKYILKSDVTDANFRAGRIFRDALLNIGPRVAPILAAEKSESKILKILKKEHTSILKEMARMLKIATKKMR